jgi:hypothetical protein
MIVRQFHRICSPFWRLERKLTEVASHFGVPQSDRFQAMSMLGKIFAKKVPCVGPNSIRTVGTVLWLQSQSSGSHALLLNEVASVVNASVEDMSKQARRLRLALMQSNVKCPKAALWARLSSLSRRTLEHLDVSLTQFLAVNLPTVSADAVKLEIQKYIDSTCDFVVIVSFDEGASPSSLAAAITFLSCSIAALNQQAYVSFARKAAVRKANQRKRSLRTTLLPLVRSPWGISISQCAGVACVHPETALGRLRRLEAVFDDCIARHFVALFLSSSPDCSEALLDESQQQRAHNSDKLTACTRSPDRTATAAASTTPILLYNRIPVVLQVAMPAPFPRRCFSQLTIPLQHLLFLSRSRCDAAAEAAADGPAHDECPHVAVIKENSGCEEDSDGSDLDRFAASAPLRLLVPLATHAGPSYILTPEQSRRKVHTRRNEKHLAVCMMILCYYAFLRLASRYFCVDCPLWYDASRSWLAGKLSKALCPPTSNARGMHRLALPPPQPQAPRGELNKRNRAGTLCGCSQMIQKHLELSP